MTFQTGSLAPDFTLPTAGGDSVHLSALRGRPVIIYFYPKDDTPGCTAQACSFRDSLPDFSALDAVVIGISKDSLKSHDKFKTKFGLNFILASDENSNVAEQYGVWGEKSMYGKKYMGIDRSTFLIDSRGILRKEWRKVKVEGHVNEVLQTLKNLHE